MTQVAPADRSNPNLGHRLKLLGFSIVAAILFSFAVGCGTSSPRVVVYCAQDQEFADQIFVDFKTSAQLSVAAHYDTEANKTVVLYDELVREKRRPRCDVFWNNEIIATIRLERQGLLEAYRSPSAAPFPASSKSKDGLWQAFAARARVLIVNTQLVKAGDMPQSLLDLAQPRWRGKVAIAKPEFGTSATHAACLFEVLGSERAKLFYRDLKRNHTAIVAGNKQVAEGVGMGQFEVGITDTDDAFGEIQAGRPVAVVFPDRSRPPSDRMGTLFIPNTLALINDAPNPQGGKKLIDYLLSPEVEAQLARSASGQIPMNPEVAVRPPPPIETPSTIKSMEVDFYKAADLWEEVLSFMRAEFARP